jgi:tetratricopeptide (TPR) repeat protein
MLTALPKAVEDGWLITVPEADFIAADGTRLEGNGVQPDIKVTSNEVFIAVAGQIEKKLPFSAAMLRGSSYEALKRPADAEKAYRASLKVADSQAPKPDVKTRAGIHKRLAAILKMRGDLQGAKREYEEVIRLIPEDAEALAAIRSTP